MTVLREDIRIVYWTEIGPDLEQMFWARAKWNERFPAVQIWLNENTTKGFSWNHQAVIFDDAGDAALFKMRWNGWAD